MTRKMKEGDENQVGEADGADHGALGRLYFLLHVLGNH